MVLAGLLGLTLVLSACGGAASRQPGTVKVYFCTTASMPDCKTDATRAQERAVGQELRQSEYVEKAVFISKAAGLARFEKRNPLLVKHLPTNPLPDEWVVTVTSDQYKEAVGKKVCAARYPGVERCSNSALGQFGGVTWRSTLAP
jgi:cell division protein FtsX